MKERRADESIWSPYGFNDPEKCRFTESWRSYIDDIDGFYALRRGLLGHYYGWWFKTKEDMNDVHRKNRVFFGFDKDPNVIKERIYEHLRPRILRAEMGDVMTKMESFSLDELRAAEDDYKRNFAPGN